MQIISAEKDSIDRLAQVLAEAMYEGSMYYYIFNDKELSLRYFKSFWEAVLTYTMKFGTVLATEDFKGAACLLPPHKTDFAFVDLFKTGFKIPLSVLGFPYPKMKKIMDILFSLGRFQSQTIPGPHWYLTAIGVKPEDQGKGIGGCLLRELIGIVNKDGRPIYLETETVKNVRLYKKYGFEVVNEITMEKHNLKYYLMIGNTSK
ncbi:MAG TPA: GNAT family N-acetyltransferase [Clostridia bacterium]|nr:GNAT family N-acetyltransferase [Clostridia bacterium]